MFILFSDVISISVRIKNLMHFHSVLHSSARAYSGEPSVVRLFRFLTLKPSYYIHPTFRHET
jgi:hypothetical protein